MGTKDGKGCVLVLWKRDGRGRRVRVIWDGKGFVNDIGMDGTGQKVMGRGNGRYFGVKTAAV